MDGVGWRTHMTRCGACANALWAAKACTTLLASPRSPMRLKPRHALIEPKTSIAQPITSSGLASDMPRGALVLPSRDCCACAREYCNGPGNAGHAVAARSRLRALDARKGLALEPHLRTASPYDVPVYDPRDIALDSAAFLSNFFRIS